MLGSTMVHADIVSGTTLHSLDFVKFNVVSVKPCVLRQRSDATVFDMVALLLETTDLYGLDGWCLALHGHRYVCNWLKIVVRLKSTVFCAVCPVDTWRCHTTVTTATRARCRV